MRLTLDNLHRYCTECGDCLRWSLGVNSAGYPQACVSRGQPAVMVRRYVFTCLLGRVVPRGCVVSSRCDDKLCIAPDHLLARRRGTVAALAYSSGRRSASAEYANRLRAALAAGGSSLDWDRVRDIRSRPKTQTNAALAAEFGVSAKSISRVRTGASWRAQVPGASVFAWGAAA